MKNGELGRIYGYTVLMHTELTAVETLFWHKSCLGFARQLGSDYHTDFQLRSVSQEYLLNHIYGVKVMDLGVRQVLFNASGT